ncbi:MAG: hypothetical protein KGP27_00895, partial [Hyphomicrobiales bacterium]|nr:hypothetical protein [Hyphomicrobiales bacterium]
MPFIVITASSLGASRAGSLQSWRRQARGRPASMEWARRRGVALLSIYSYIRAIATCDRACNVRRKTAELPPMDFLREFAQANPAAVLAVGGLIIGMV